MVQCRQWALKWRQTRRRAQEAQNFQAEVEKEET